MRHVLHRGRKASCAGQALALLGCLLAIAATARAADYYVDAASPGGDGSPASPFKTIQQGLNAAHAGDNVIVRAGRYTLTSTLTFPRSGTADSPITLKAAPGETVLVEVWPGLNIHLIQTSRSYITIEDITFDGNYSTANGMIRLDGGSFQTFRRCEMRRQGNHLLRIDSSDLLVEDCHIHHAIWPASPSTDAHCLHSQTGFRHTFLRCDLHHATGDIWQGSRDGAWGDIVFDSCDLHIELADDDCNGIAPGTPITENHLDTKNMPGLVNYNVTVRHCLVRGSRKGRLGTTSAALNLKDGVSGFFIHHNILTDNAMTFRLRYPSTDYHIYNNLVYDNDSAVRLEDGVSNLVFTNNTFYGNLTLIQDVGSAAPLTWTNNIFASSFFGSAWPGTFQHNLFWAVPSASWQTANGNMRADPLFAAAGAYDLHLAAESPAINAALAAPGIVDDADGDPRPIGAAPDIGADEFHYPGDVDRDGDVNVFDVFMIAESWNTTVGDPAYNPAADLDGDGFVNVFDIFVIAEDWGKSL